MNRYRVEFIPASNYPRELSKALQMHTRGDDLVSLSPHPRYADLMVAVFTEAATMDRVRSESHHPEQEGQTESPPT